jgi:isocitrate dehydrogenase
MEVVIFTDEKSPNKLEATDVKVNLFPRRQDYSFKRKYTIEKVGEIIDSSVMHLEALKSFVAKAIAETKKKISCYRFI